MKKFINFCIKYVLFIYTNHIYEDWSIYTKLGKIYFYPVWFVRSCIVWAVCPIFLPEYWYKQSSIYAYMKKLEDSPEYKAQMAKSMNMFNL